MRPLRLLAVALLLVGCRTTDSPAPVVAQSPTPLPSVASPRASPSPRSPYAVQVQRVTSADLPHSWHPGCPVAPSQLRLLTLPYRDYGGVRRTGRIVVNARVVTSVVSVFRTLYVDRFPIRSVRVIDEFGGSDDRSMAADNTSGFNCRQAVGGSGWSQHAYGLAIDVNPRENPYVLNGDVLPPEGAAYTNRSDHRPGMAYRGSVLNRAFAGQGWGWGGRWRNPDYQHFSHGDL